MWRPEIIFFSPPRKERLWWHHADLLLRGDAVEKVCQARPQVFLPFFFFFLLGLVCQHSLPERPAEVEGLKHGVTVAGVSEADQSEAVFTDWKLLWTDVLLPEQRHRAHITDRGDVSDSHPPTGRGDPAPPPL